MSNIGATVDKSNQAMEDFSNIMVGQRPSLQTQIDSIMQMLDELQATRKQRDADNHTAKHLSLIHI